MALMKTSHYAKMSLNVEFMQYEFEQTTDKMKVFCLENHFSIQAHTKEIDRFLVKTQCVAGYAIDLEKFFKKYELNEKQKRQFLYHCPTCKIIAFAKSYVAAFEFWLLNIKNVQSLGNVHIFSLTYANLANDN
jgi:hypothetical protein